MSPRAWQFRLSDILDAIEKIRAYTQGMRLDDFKADDKTVDAVVRNFIVIGESAGNVPTEIVAKYPDVPWRLMRDMRNFAVHEYWGVDESVIWKTIHEDLPPLIEQLQSVAEHEQE